MPAHLHLTTNQKRSVTFDRTHFLHVSIREVSVNMELNQPQANGDGGVVWDSLKV